MKYTTITIIRKYHKWEIIFDHDDQDRIKIKTSPNCNQYQCPANELAKGVERLKKFMIDKMNRDISYLKEDIKAIEKLKC